MAYFIYDNQAHAMAASEQRWTQFIRHPKNPEDTTQYAWSVLVGLDGRAAVDASQFGTAVPPQTGYQSPPVSTLDPANWPPHDGSTPPPLP